MNTPPVYTVHLTGNIPGDTPCLCMRCPECRGYVMDTREPIDPTSRLRDWKPNAKDLREQAAAMEVEANEGRPAVLISDRVRPNKGGRPRKRRA